MSLGLVVGHFDSPIPYQTVFIPSQLTGSGWVIADSEVNSVALYLNETFLCQALLGIARPDIAQRFPSWSNAPYSGFSFSADVGPSDIIIDGDNRIALHVQTASTTAIVKEVPLIIYHDRLDAELPEKYQTEYCSEHPWQPLAKTENSILRFCVDTPKRIGNQPLIPISGVLKITGWAFSPGGLKEITVTLNGNEQYQARTGIRRPDVADMFPSSSEGLLSGFESTIPRLPPGEHIITIMFYTNEGMSSQTVFGITVESLEDSTKHLRPRRFLTSGSAQLPLAALERLNHKPHFRVIIRKSETSRSTDTAYNITLQSLRAQAYPDWRVFEPGDPIAQDLPETPSNDAHELLLILRAGDQLGCDALLCFAVEYALHQTADFIYCDDVRWDPALRLTQPWFKPNWAPNLLLSTNYIGRAWCCTASLFHDTQMTEVGAEVGDYDMVLRLTEAATEIRHIPELLLEHGQYTTETPSSERQALVQAMRRRKIDAEISKGLAEGIYRVKRTMYDLPLISIIIPTCGANKRIETALSTLRKETAYHHYEIICIDNLPETHLAQKNWLHTHSDHTIEIQTTFNWSYFNNIGADFAKGEYLLFLNDDVEICDSHWLQALLEHAARPDVGAVGGLLCYPNGTIQHAGMYLDGTVARHAFRSAAVDHPGNFGLSLAQRDVIAVTGACMMVRRETFINMGGFKESHAVVNNDVDFCLRLHRAGLTVVYTPYAKLVHHELSSRSHLPDLFDEVSFVRDWELFFLKGDPFFNPHLSIEADDYCAEAEPFEALSGLRPLLEPAQVREILVLLLDPPNVMPQAFPACRQIKKLFPNAKIRVLCSTASQALAKLEPSIDSLIILDEFGILNGPASADQETQLSNTLLAYHFDIAVDLCPKPDTRELIKMSGATLFAGFEFDNQYPWLHVALEWEGDTRLCEKRDPRSFRMLQLVDALGRACISTALPGPQQPLGSRLAAAAGGIKLPDGFCDRPLVCIDPSSTSEMQRWPLASFVALADLLICDEGLNVVFVATAEWEAVIAEIIQKLHRPESALSLAGRVTIEHFPDVLRACCLFIGNDTGLQHVAAEIPMPTIAIHSSHIDPTEHAASGPHAVTIRRKVVCGPCYLSSPSQCHRDLFCMNSIRPGEVYDICQRLLRLVYDDPRTSVLH